jgi:hypothetical protein
LREDDLGFRDLVLDYFDATNIALTASACPTVAPRSAWHARGWRAGLTWVAS